MKTKLKKKEKEPFKGQKYRIAYQKSLKEDDEERINNLKKLTDPIYEVGKEHGRVEMKNLILKKLNTDIKLFYIKSTAELIVTILKKIDKIDPAVAFNSLKSREK